MPKKGVYGGTYKAEVELNAGPIDTVVDGACKFTIVGAKKKFSIWDVF